MDERRFAKGNGFTLLHPYFGVWMIKGLGLRSGWGVLGIDNP
jgi:hypothetical protein